MSTLVYEFEPEGEVQAVSPDGQKVAMGTTTLRVVHVPNPSAIWPIGPGRSPRFLDDDHVTWIRPVTDDKAQRFVADLRAFNAGVPPTDDDTLLVAANEFEASAGHWASAFTATRRLAYDNRRLTSGVTSVRMAGRYLLTVRDNVVFEVYHDGIIAWSVVKPTDANEFQISTEGWITCGYYGVSHLITPDAHGGGALHDISVAPWSQEGPARLVHLPDGSVWAWSATNNRVEESLVLGRPLVQGADGSWRSRPECVVLPDFPATSLLVGWWAERASFTIAGSANLGHSTPCQVHVVPATAARAAVPDPGPSVDPPAPVFDPTAEYDVLDFMLGEDGPWPRTGNPGHYMNTDVHRADRWFAQVKSGDPSFAGWLTWDDQWVRLWEDHTNPPFPNYYFTDGRWAPRRIKGSASFSVDGNQRRDWTGTAWGDPVPFPYTMTSTIVAAYDFGGEIGVLPALIQDFDNRPAAVTDPKTGVTRRPGSWERTVWAYKRGIGRFQSWKTPHDGGPDQLEAETVFNARLSDPLVTASLPRRPFGEIEDQVNAPGVSIDAYDPVIRPGQPWKIVFHDRNNDMQATVEFKDGSVYASLKNAAGEDKSGNKRPVAVQP